MNRNVFYFTRNGIGKVNLMMDAVKDLKKTEFMKQHGERFAGYKDDAWTALQDHKKAVAELEKSEAEAEAKAEEGAEEAPAE